MKRIRIILIACILMICAACKEMEPVGSIAFTAAVDCQFRLFDSKGREIAFENYEVGKEAAVVEMKSTGVFVLQATSEGKESVKEPLHYHGGDVEYFIEF